MSDSYTSMESHKSSSSSVDSCGSLSRGSVSLEFDDYPLDLISPVRRDDLEEYPSAWRPIPPCHQDDLDRGQTNAMAEPSNIPEEEIPLNPEATSGKKDEEKDTAFGDTAKTNGTVYFNRNTTLPKVHTKPPVKTTVQEAVLYDMLKGLQENTRTPRHCQACRACWVSCSRPCWTKYHPLPTSATWAQRLRYSIMCPPHGHVGHALSLGFVTLLIWTICYALTGSQALPGGHFFALVMLVVFGYVGGLAVSLIRLPPLVGE